MRQPTIFVTILFGFAFILTFGCKSPPDKITPSYIAEQFYNGYNNLNFEQVKKYSSDSIKIIWKGNVVCRSLNELHLGFQYDSVLSSEIKILEINSKNKALEVTLSKFDKRIKYLHDTAFVYKAMIYIADNQISQIEINNYILLDLNKKQSREDSLVVWINKNHPELTGFEKDQSIIGAQNYLTAIELFNNKNEV